MTQAVRFHETGGPNVLQVENVSVGEPGPGELRLRVEAIGLNRAEALFRQDAYLERPQLPAGLGYEGTGVVDACGPGVEGFAVGDAVCVIPSFSLNAYSLCAEQALVPIHSVVKRPTELDAVTGAAVWMPYLTAYGALIDIGHLSAGQAVVITAASSSVGLAAIQIANSVGAVPIATTRTQAKAEALRNAGAAHVVVTEEQSVRDEVMRITDDHGAAQIFDPVAGSSVEALAQALTQNGILFIYGGLSGEPTPFPHGTALLKGMTMRGYTLFEIFTNELRFERAKRFVFDGLASGAFKPTLDRSFKLADTAAAHEYMEGNGQFGKIVITV